MDEILVFCFISDLLWPQFLQILQGRLKSFTVVRVRYAWTSYCSIKCCKVIIAFPFLIIFSAIQSIFSSPLHSFRGGWRVMKQLQWQTDSLARCISRYRCQKRNWNRTQLHGSKFQLLITKHQEETLLGKRLYNKNSPLRPGSWRDRNIK